MILPNDILIRATPDGQTVWVSQRMVCEACGIDEDYFEKAKSFKPWLVFPNEKDNSLT